MRSSTRPAMLVGLLLVGVALAGCGSPARSLVQNGGFEQGDAPWSVIATSGDWIHFEVTDQVAVGGNHSLRTHLQGRATPSSSLVAGALQSIDGTGLHHLPAHLTGHMLALRWDSDAPKTYVQVVLMLQAPNGTQAPICGNLDPRYLCQLAFVLGGVSQRPIAIANRQFVFVRTAPPTIGQWLDFDLPVAAAFREQWGAVDPPLAQMRVYLEARYEQPDGGRVPQTDVDVYWDDIAMAP